MSGPKRVSPIQAYINNMTPERLIQLARRPQGLRVHRYRYREKKIAMRVAALVKDGKLRKRSQDREECVYEAVT